MWFEELGFDESPFEDSPEARMIGYDDVIEDSLYNAYAGNIIFLEGKEGSGKTSVLRRVIHKFKGQGKVVYLKCSEIKDLNVEEVLIKKYGIIRRLFSKTPKDMILLFDDIEDLSRKNTERIKYFYDQGYIRSIIFTGINYKRLNFSDSLKDRITKIVKIPDLNDNDAIEIVEERLQGKDLIPENIIKEAFKRSSKNVKAFLKTCEDLVRYALQEKSEKVTDEHARVIFEGERIVKEKEETKEEKPKKSKKNPKEEKPQEKSKEVISDDDGIKVIYEDIAEKYY
jgi:chromosomal replication initiation ATPase DnaA